MTCAACGRPIPVQYRPGVVTAAGPMHPGCHRKLNGVPAVNPWEVTG